MRARRLSKRSSELYARRAEAASKNEKRNGVRKMGLERLILLSHLNEEQQEVVDIIGMDNYKALISVFGGSAIWIPKARSLIPTPEIVDYIKTRLQKGDLPGQIARDLEMPAAEVRRLSK